MSQVTRFVLATVGNGQRRSGYGALSIWLRTNKFERFLASELTQSALSEICTMFREARTVDFNHLSGLC